MPIVPPGRTDMKCRGKFDSVALRRDQVGRWGVRCGAGMVAPRISLTRFSWGATENVCRPVIWARVEFLKENI